jgi:hypothetical protein
VQFQDATCQCLLKLASRFEVKESIIIDRLLRSTDALRARKQAIFVEMGEIVFEAMCQLRPQPKKQPSLRLVEMIAIGVMHVSMEGWPQDNGRRSLVKFLEENFSILKAGILTKERTPAAAGCSARSEFHGVSQPAPRG